MEDEVRKKMQFLMAQKRMEQIRDFYMHFVIYCTVNTLFVAFWFFMESSMPKTFWAPAFFMMTGIAGFAVLAHALLVFGPKYLLPKDWEEKKFKKLMEKTKEKDGKGPKYY